MPVFLVVLIGIGGLSLVILMVWVGMQIKPRPFPAYMGTTPVLDTIPIPQNLPASVGRYFRAISTDQDRLPHIHSAVISGRAGMRINGIRFQARFRFIHEAGQNYRHYIEGTCFGRPLLVVNERYVDDISRIELPFGSSENEPKNNQAANLGLWGESIWLPSVFLTHPRARWEAIAPHAARLVVPFEDGEDEFLIRFDSNTGLIARMEADRFKGETAVHKTRWIVEPYDWREFHGCLVPSPAAVTWEDEGRPWAIFDVEEIIYNVDMTESVRRKGL